MRAIIKKYKNKNGTYREYLCIVESYWDKEKKAPRTREICNLGRVDLENAKEALVSGLIESLGKLIDKKQTLELTKEVTPISSKTFGEIPIFRKIWNKLGIDKVLKGYFAKTNRSNDFVEAIFMMVCNKLIDPRSKRGTDIWKSDVYEPAWENIGLHTLYRAMDFLQEHKESVELDLFNSARDLFNSKVDVVMFDTTSLSYWGEGEHAPELLKFGVAKNKRNDLKQIVVGIIMDQNGVPLGHEVWEGNKSDKPAFKEIIDKIKKSYAIEKVILVADRGMISEENIQYLESNNYEYVLGVKMRQLSSSRKQLILNRSFEKIPDSPLLYSEISQLQLWKEEHPNFENDEQLKAEYEIFSKTSQSKRRWVTCLNPLIAKIDKAKREYFHKILEQKVEYKTAKEWIIHNGYKKYVIIDEFSIRLNTDKLLEEEIYDGKWVLITNTSQSASALIKTYKDLSHIERHFRDLKSELETAPIFHYMERRIRAHVFICFLALQIKVAFTKLLKAKNPDVSYGEVMNDVRKIKAVTFSVPGKEFIMRTQFEGNANLAYLASGTQIPKQLLKEQEI